MSAGLDVVFRLELLEDGGVTNPQPSISFRVRVHDHFEASAALLSELPG
jgi:hypothetical protein